MNFRERLRLRDRFRWLQKVLHPRLPELELISFPANKFRDTSPQEVLLAWLVQKITAALVLAATGDALTADLVVNEGHSHDDEDSYLWWRQLGSWQFTSEREGFSVEGREGHKITETSETLLLLVPVLVPTWVKRIYPRLRLSSPAPGTATPTRFTLRTGICENAEELPQLAQAPDFVIESYAGRSYSDEWVEGPPIDLEDVPLPEEEGGRRIVVLRLSGWVGTGGAAVTVWEYQLNLLEGP
jgi:hypothetical protein